MRPTSRFLQASLFLLAVIASCAPKFPSDPTIPDRLCKAMCDRHVECQPSKWNAARCVSTCLADPGPLTKYGGGARQYFRADYVEAILQCTATASCDAIEEEERYRGQCYADTQPPPSPRAKRVCALEQAKFKECGGKAPRDTCIEDYGGIRDEVLVGAERCLADDGCGWGIECWNQWADSTRAR